MKQKLKLLFLYYFITNTSMNIISCSCIMVKEAKDLRKAISFDQHLGLITLAKRVSTADLKNNETILTIINKIISEATNLGITDEDYNLIVTEDNSSISTNANILNVIITVVATNNYKITGSITFRAKIEQPSQPIVNITYQEKQQNTNLQFLDNDKNEWIDNLIVIYSSLKTNLKSNITLTKAINRFIKTNFLVDVSDKDYDIILDGASKFFTESCIEVIRVEAKPNNDKIIGIMHLKVKIITKSKNINNVKIENASLRVKKGTNVTELASNIEFLALINKAITNNIFTINPRVDYELTFLESNQTINNMMEVNTTVTAKNNNKKLTGSFTFKTNIDIKMIADLVTNTNLGAIYVGQNNLPSNNEIITAINNANRDAAFTANDIAIFDITTDTFFIKSKNNNLSANSKIKFNYRKESFKAVEFKDFNFNEIKQIFYVSEKFYFTTNTQLYEGTIEDNFVINLQVVLEIDAEVVSMTSDSNNNIYAATKNAIYKKSAEELAFVNMNFNFKEDTNDIEIRKIVFVGRKIFFTSANGNVYWLAIARQTTSLRIVRESKNKNEEKQAKAKDNFIDLKVGNKVYVIDENNLFYIDPINPGLLKHNTASIQLQVLSLLFIVDSTIYVGTNNGLIYITTDMENFSIWATVPSGDNVGQAIKAIIKDKADNLYIATLQKGIYHSKHTKNNDQSNDFKKRWEVNGEVRHIFLDKKENFYALTTTGFFISTK